MFKVKFYNDEVLKAYISNLERSNLRKVENTESPQRGTFNISGLTVTVYC